MITGRRENHEQKGWCVIAGVVQAHEEKFGGSFNQSKLHNLAKLGFLKPEWSRQILAR